MLLEVLLEDLQFYAVFAVGLLELFDLFVFTLDQETQLTILTLQLSQGVRC